MGRGSAPGCSRWPMRCSCGCASAPRSARSAPRTSTRSTACPGSCPMDEVLREISRIVREELGVPREPTPADDLLTDLQLDSVGLLTLVVGLEDKFHITLQEDDAAGVRTVQDLV